jgi:hypothetical protein
MLLTLDVQVAEFYATFDPQVSGVQQMLDKAKQVDKKDVSQYLGT